MTEEAKRCVNALQNNIRNGFYLIGNSEFSMSCKDLIDLIESLSTENEMLNAAIGQLGAIECERDMLEHVLEQVTRERDALLNELRGECNLCTHWQECLDGVYSGVRVDDSCWEWKGVEVEG